MGDSQAEAILVGGSCKLTEEQLWKRRFDVVTRRADGDSVWQISEHYEVTPATIYNDIEEYHRQAQIWLHLERSVTAVANHYDRVIRRMNQTMDKAEAEGKLGLIAGLASEANKAIAGKAIIYGLISPTISNNSSITNIILPNKWGKRSEPRPMPKPSRLPIEPIDEAILCPR